MLFSLTEAVLERQREVNLPIGTQAERCLYVADVAAAHACTVDRTASFPDEAIGAAKAKNLLALQVPVDCGGEDATISDLAEICFTVAKSCGSTAMIIAMHHAALACIVRHGRGSAWYESLLHRVSSQNLLLASSTTEGNGGGNVRASDAPLTREGDTISFQRAATVLSYGAHADVIVTTARRAADRAATDQVLVAFDKRDYELVATGSWQTLGMRGTCSAGFALKAVGRDEQIAQAAYGRIHAQTMLPVSHLLWCSVWVGIAAAAVSRAQSFLREASRRANGQSSPGAPRYTNAVANLNGLRARLAAALAYYEGIRDDPETIGSMEAQAAFNLLKVEISEGAVATVSGAMRACGLAGYREDSEFSIGRHLRDILSAPIMIHNDRILSNVAATTLLCPAPNALGMP